MRANFILSLDCEGKWGVADHLSQEHKTGLTDERLLTAYRAIRALLTEFEIPATFAVTEAFLLPRPRQLALPWDEITRLLPYAAPAAVAIESKDEGWSAPWLKDLIRDRDELACHGFTHAPWGTLTREQASFEIDQCTNGAGRTFVYPRNQVNHVDLLHEAKFVGYRAAPPQRSRVASLASEMNLTARSQSRSSTIDPVEIPSGYFVNWLHGLRRLVPTTITRARARRVIEHAAATGGVAHYWTHPENIAQSPATLSNLRVVLEEAARSRDQGRLSVHTQASYAAQGH